MAHKRSLEEANIVFPVWIDRLTHEATRLKVNPAALAAIVALFGDNATAHTWVYVMLSYADKKGKRTPVVTEEMNTLHGRLEKMFSDIFNDIPASVWNNEDRLIFDRKTGDHAAPTKKTEVITVAPTVEIEILGNKELDITFRLPHESSKASMHPEATMVESVFSYVDSTLAESELSTKVQNTRPLTPNECLETKLFTKAKSDWKLDTDRKASEICGFSRYIDPKYPHLAGPYGPMWIISIA